MSMEALLFAVRNQLRAKLNYSPQVCEIMPDGKPSPGAGEKFVAVYFGYENDAGSHGESLDQYFGVNVTLSVRIAKAPIDRVGPDIIAVAGTGLLAEARRIQAIIHMDPDGYAIVKAANVLIGPNFNGFIEPLQWTSTNYLGVQGAAWYRSKKGTASGVAVTLAFGKARRVEKIGNQQLPTVPAGFLVMAPGLAVPGTPFAFSVQAIDSLGNVVTGYAGTVQFASTDAAATLPSSVVLSGGQGIFSATLETNDLQTISAQDTVQTFLVGQSGDIGMNTANPGNYAGSTIIYAGSTVNYVGAL